jgi:hypothetical protein
MFHSVLQVGATTCMAATTCILTSRSGLVSRFSNVVSRFINTLFSMLSGQSGENSCQDLQAEHMNMRFELIELR